MPEIDLFAEETGGATMTLTKKDKERIAYLEKVLPVLKYLHGEGKPTINPVTNQFTTDSEFDAMRKELFKLAPNSTALTGVASAAPIDPNAKKMKHSPPMTSIKKINGSEKEKSDELEKWLNLIAKEFKLTVEKVKELLVVSFKHDGLASSVRYVNGKLTQAGLRSDDGNWGEDITENVKYVKGLPQQLSKPLTFVIRGEIECKKSTFKRLNGSIAVESQEFANPRNYATGSIRQFKNPEKTKTRELSFTGYKIIDLKDAPYKTEKECAIWCNKELGIPYVRIENFTDTIIPEMEIKVPDLDYEVDGAVLVVNDFDQQEQLGLYGSDSTSEPKGKAAWKFKDDEADPVIADIPWETGRTGQISPVCTFDDVALAGTMVGRAAAHSLGFLVRNNIHIGTRIKIRKSGKIIPEVLGSFDGTKYNEKIDGGDSRLPVKFDFDKFDYPKTCPSCGEKTKVFVGGSHGMFELRCENTENCPAQNMKLYEHYLNTFGVKGLGEATITQILEAGLIKKFADFYTLSIKELQAAGRSKRESLLDVARIHMVDEPEQEKDNQVLAKRTVDAIKKKKKISLGKFISCLGIKNAGKGTGSNLSYHFKSLDKIMNATKEEFLECKDIGETIAKSLVLYFSQNKKAIEELVEKYLELELPKTGKFTGKNFVFSGSPPDGRDKETWYEIVENEGGIIKGSVGKDVDYIVVGAGSGAKSEKAKEMQAEGHRIIIIDTRDALLKLFS